jgi:hypothetical protein
MKTRHGNPHQWELFTGTPGATLLPQGFQIAAKASSSREIHSKYDVTCGYQQIEKGLLETTTSAEEWLTCVGKGILQSPLNQRAWVIQERLLSPRILHFGENQLFWECSEREAWETFPDGTPTNAQSFGDSMKYKAKYPYGMLTPRAPRPTSWDPNYLGIWNSIISAYSASQLTRSTDKLVAISGIARDM